MELTATASAAGASKGARLGIIMGMELMPCTAAAVDSTAVDCSEGAALGSHHQVSSVKFTRHVIEGLELLSALGRAK